MIGWFFMKMYRIIGMRLYSNETVILLKHQKRVHISSAAIIKDVTGDNVNDALHFQSPIQVRLFRRFLRHGDKGYYAYLGNKCVHRSWVVVSPQKVKLHKFFSLSLRPSDVFIHYCETAPEARGRNIFTAVLAHISETFSSKNIYIGVEETNRASISSIIKSGFVESGKVHILVRFGIKRIRINATSSDIYDLSKR
jgi:hypothetical protein